MAAPPSQGVDINSLSASQLGSIKKQLDEELEHFTNSFSKLRSAQVKFRECEKAIESGVNDVNTAKAILVPLTASLYVPGKLSDPHNVMIDIGTGFFVEKTNEEAISFYQSRIGDIDRNLKELEAILQGKSNNLKAVEDVLRLKVLEGNSSQPS